MLYGNKIKYVLFSLIIICIIITIFFIQGVGAQSIRVTGQWNYTIPSSDITEAGNDFTGTYESNVNQVYLDIFHYGKWSVSVQKNNIDFICIWI